LSPARFPQANLLVPKARGQVNKAVRVSRPHVDCLLPSHEKFGEMIAE